MKRVSRPFMFTGLLISLFAYIGSVALCAFLVITYISVAASVGNEITNIVYFIIIALSVVIMIFALLGLIFSAISLSRCNLPASAFFEKKGMVITTLVFNILIIALYVFSLATAFNVETLIVALTFAIASALIIVDLARNKKLLMAEDQEKEQKEAVTINQKDSTEAAPRQEDIETK